LNPQTGKVSIPGAPNAIGLLDVSEKDGVQTVKFIKFVLEPTKN